MPNLPDPPELPELPGPATGAPAGGHIELERKIDSITVGVRYRKDPGDLTALMHSIEEVGLLQPITITPSGVLVCGWRRLEAVRRLGWRTLKVWVRSGISDELSHLLAQQDENEQRKPLTQLETAALYAEVKRLIAEDGARRQEATRFGAQGTSGRVNGDAGPASPHGAGESRRQASLLVTGSQSYARLEQVNWINRIATDSAQPPSVREFARNMLAEIEDGTSVEPAYKRVKAAVELASKPSARPAGCDDEDDQDDRGDLERLAQDALARVRQAQARSGVRALQRKPNGLPTYRSVRSFILTWTELEGWTQLYDVDELARELKDVEWERFRRVVAESTAFTDRLRHAREALLPA